jgi:succinate dehydrogenase flavin-adding protein (antitoxin of CptAB toxin-antitoxin module)
MTMADQAVVQRAPQPTPGQIFAPPTQEGILASDLLPAEARQDPNFRDGPGAMYAAHQPTLAKKYGVIRNGKPIPAQMLTTGTPGEGGLRASTVEGLAEVMKFNQDRKKAEGPDAIAEEASAKSAAGAAAAAGNGPGDRNIKPVDVEEVKKRINAMDDFDFAAFRQVMMKDLLNNDEQRKIIEERLPALELTDLIMNGFVTQVVPIIPDKFEPEFQSMSAEEDLALKRLVMEETKSLGATEAYMLDKFSIMSVACGTRAINKKQLPDHRDKEGKFDEDRFRLKFNLVVRYPFHMIASLGVNYFWFDVRVRKLFVAEKIKNG